MTAEDRRQKVKDKHVMKKRTIGRTEIQVPSVCLGAMGFSELPESADRWMVDYPTSKAIIQAALNAGLNFFDTAPVYSDGSSEKALGKALKELRIPRDEVVISTKFYPRSNEEIEQGISMNDHVRAWLEGSLRRLQTDYVDLYYLHMWDWNTPVDELLDVLDELKKEGKIRAYGLSNVWPWQISMANEKAIARGMEPFAAVQNQWNLISREDEIPMMECLKEYHMSPIPYASLAAGRLARPLGTETKRARTDRYGEKKFSTQKEADARVILDLEECASKLDKPMSSVALAWLMSKGAIPLAGATSKSQIQGLAEASEIVLDTEMIDQLERNYVPHQQTGVLAEHTPEQDCYQAYGVNRMKQILRMQQALSQNDET